jgi:hypothetical protein
MNGFSFVRNRQALRVAGRAVVAFVGRQLQRFAGEFLSEAE